MDSMRRNAQKMMPHIMAMNKKPNVGMKNDRQPAPAVSKLVAFAKGGKVMAKGGAADKKQDKSMLARHNRLMHPGQKSKLMNGGMVKGYANGGATNPLALKFEKERDAPVKFLKGEEPKKASREKSVDMSKRVGQGQMPKEAPVKGVKTVVGGIGGGILGAFAPKLKAQGRKVGEIDAFEGMSPEPGVGDTDAYYSGKLAGRNRQAKAKKDNALSAYANRGKDYIKDKLDDADVAISKKIGLKERAKRKESFRMGLKEEGYKKGGKVKGDKKKVMGTVGEAKSIMAALKKARRPATPMPGTPMAGLGMAPPMAPQMPPRMAGRMAPPMKHGGKVMKKAAGGAAKLRRKSPMPDKIKMVNYSRGG